MLFSNQNRLFAKIDNSDKILLLTHENPDGDAIGSILALRYILQKIGKKVTSACPDDLPQPFLFLPKAEEIQKDFLLGDYDLIIILDCGDLRRTGFPYRLREMVCYKKKIINIDHHPKNDLHHIASLNLVDYQASSTAEIIYHLFSGKIKFDKDIATCLLCALYTDTGTFQHSNTTPEVLKIAAQLMSYGARLKYITRHITIGKSVPALRLWGRALSRIRFHQDLGLAISVITKEDMLKCSAQNSDLSGVVNLINAIPEAKATILFSELEDGKIKASLRTEFNKVDVSRLANIFGGGGLKKAAGFTIEGKIIANGDKGWEIIQN